MPAPVDTGIASWLKSEAMYRTRNISLPSGLQPMATDSEIITPFATSAAADTELARQGALLDYALAQDVAVIAGRRSDLAGKCVTLYCDQLGYDAGVNVLVLQANEQEDGTTQLVVLRNI
jgi:hypothetical protein